MNGTRLVDRQYYAMGVAARQVGGTTDAFRPHGVSDPLRNENRFLRLQAAFLPMEGGLDHANGYGRPDWRGIFDASYTKPGDYLVQDDRIFFVAAQQPLLPVLCILTNRIISIMRPSLQTAPADNPYGGYTTSNISILLENWPASVLGVTGKGTPTAGLPTDEPVPFLSILLSSVTSVVFSPGDLMSDDLGRSAVITGSELTDLGWRMTAKMATN